MRRRLASGQLFPQLLEGLGIGIVAVNVAEILQQFGERLLIDSAAIMGNAVTSSLPQLIQCPSGFRDANDRNIQWSFLIILWIAGNIFL